MSSSFDVVNKVDRQEVDNAVQQASKELAQRYDFRGTGAGIEWSGAENVVVQAETEERMQAAVDVFKEKLVRRNLSLKTITFGDPRQSGKTFRIIGSIQQGISTDEGKKIAKLIRDEGPKGVQAQIQSDQLRVSSKKRDDLQAVIALLKSHDFEVPLQFVNYR
jgi:cyclic-di-GMP-binding protein